MRARRRRPRRRIVPLGITTLAGLVACVCLALGLSAAQADQLDIPPPPAPADTDPGGDGSESGYPNASETQAEGLFTTEFSNTVTSLAADPADLGPDARYLNAHTALVAPGTKSPAEFKDAVEQILDQDQGDIDAARSDLNDLVDSQNAGSSELTSATLPLRTADDTGHQAPIDLSLDPQGTGYVPDNPLVDLKLPNSLANDVTVGDEGIKVDVGATEAATADGISGGDNLFYHEAATDTDVVLAPLSVGFETLYQLRSAQSPEQLEMGFTLPAGASLEHSDGGGAQIVKDGNTLATVSAPAATDAAGNEVKVTTSVSGDSLDLHVSHQDEHIAYPINVDPVTDVYTGSNGEIGAFSTDWTASKTSGSAYQTGTTCVQNVSCTSGTTGPRGLYLHAPTNQTYTTGQAATWLYMVPHWAPSTAYITDLTLGPMDYDRHSGTSTNPYLAGGIISSSLTWLSSFTQSTNIDDTYWIMGPPTGNTTGKLAVVQLYAASTQSLTHWRHAFLAGAQIGLSDTDNPTTSIDTNALTSGWIDGKQTTSFQVPVADGGLGVTQVMTPGPDGYDTTTFPSQSSPCVGTHASICPQSATANAGYYPDMWPEGQSESLAIVWDPVGHIALPTWNIRVDKTPPQIPQISGGLSESPSGDPYSLHVEATDSGGSSSNPANWRSGVRRIQVFINNQQVADSGLKTCTAQAGSCPLTLTPDYTPDPSDFSTDQLHFKVMATDELGHTRSEEWDVEIPNSSIGSGPSGPTSDATPSFTYSSSVSGSSFQCRIDGGAFTACPSSGYTSQHLTDGQHTFSVRATNPRGQVDQTPASRSFTVDAAKPVLSLSGELKDAADSGDALTASSYGLHIEASPGASMPEAALKNLEIKLDDQQALYTDQTCGSASCTMSEDWTLDTEGMAAGPHAITVSATDQVGDPQTATLQATVGELSGGGILSDLSYQHYDLPDASSGDVNLANGNLVLSTTDVNLASEDIDLVVDRYYNSRASRQADALSPGWRLSVGPDVRIEEWSGGSQRLVGPSGDRSVFQKQPDGTYVSPAGVDATLSDEGSDGHQLILAGSEEVLHFDGSGTLVSRTSPNGTTINYSYADGRLTEMTGPLGEQLTFTYDNSGRLSQIALPEGGSSTYSYDADGNLTSQTGPAGETTEYSYQGGNLTAVTYPDGSSTAIAYDHSRRVTALDPAQVPTEDTSFDFGPNENIVSQAGEQTTVDHQPGLVITATHTPSPPTLDLSGSLYAARGTTLDDGGAYALQVDATDPSGVKEIAFLDNTDDGGYLEIDSAEQPCDPNCGSLAADFALEVDSLSAGAHVFTVLVTDGSGSVRSERFEAAAPEAVSDDGVPIDPEEEAPPPTEAELVADATDFRQEFGLNASQQHVEDTLADPSLSEATDAYGVPLTQSELNSVEHQQDIADSLDTVDDWAQSHAPNAYAGVYIDPEVGGLVHVGFTSNAASRVEQLSSTFPYPGRLQSFDATYTEDELDNLTEQVTDDLDQLNSEGIELSAIYPSVDTNRVTVGMPSPTPQAESRLHDLYGPGISVVALEGGIARARDRVSQWRPLRAGLRLVGEHYNCTSGYGARNVVGHFHGAKRKRAYVLTDGHCGLFGDRFDQGRHHQRIGRIDKKFSGGNADAARIRLADDDFVPRRIYVKPNKSQRVTAVNSGHEHLGDQVCDSGFKSNRVRCGHLVNTHATIPWYDELEHHRATMRNMRLASGNVTRIKDGDSGAPVYDPHRGSANATALGLEWGTVGNCPGDGCYMVYSAIQNVKDKLNLDNIVKAR